MVAGIRRPGARGARAAARSTANLDLEMAYDRVKAARAVFVERNLDYAPHVQLDGGYSNSDEQQPGFGTEPIQHARATAWDSTLPGKSISSVTCADPWRPRGRTWGGARELPRTHK